MKTITHNYYKALAFLSCYTTSAYRLSCMFVLATIVIGLFLTNDVYAGNTSSGSLDEAYDATKGWVGDVFRFLGIVSILISVITIVAKFNALVLMGCLAVGLMSMFGIEVMEEMTGALI